MKLTKRERKEKRKEEKKEKESKSAWWKTKFIVIVAFLLVGVACYFSGHFLWRSDEYLEGYSRGSLDGYSEGYSLGRSYGILENPTWKNLWDFLEDDKVSENKYIEESYVCSHFTRDIVKNAKSAGIRCGIAIVEYADLPIGDVFSVFETEDAGVVSVSSANGPDFPVYPIVGEALEAWYNEEWTPAIVRDIVIIW